MSLRRLTPALNLPLCVLSIAALSACDAKDPLRNRACDVSIMDNGADLSFCIEFSCENCTLPDCNFSGSIQAESVTETQSLSCSGEQKANVDVTNDNGVEISVSCFKNADFCSELIQSLSE